MSMVCLQGKSCAITPERFISEAFQALYKMFGLYHLLFTNCCGAGRKTTATVRHVDASVGTVTISTTSRGTRRGRQQTSDGP